MSEDIKTVDAQIPADTKSSPEPVAAISGDLQGQEKVEVETADFVNPLTSETKEEVKTDTKTDEPVDNKETLEYTDFIIPEGLEMNKEMVESFKPLAKELGLNQEQAQKLVDFQTGFVKQQADNFKIEAENIAKELTNQTLKRLSENGKDYKKELVYADKAMMLLSADKRSALRETLDKSGVGRHPDLVEYFVEVGKRISEDSFVEGKSNAIEKKDIANTLFGDVVEKLNK
jgi:hypothetical protein